MPPSLVKAIDNYRFGNHITSRAEAIRKLLEFALEHIRNETNKMTLEIDFELARLQILCSFSSNNKLLDKGFVYAWNNRIYPTQTESKLAEKLDTCFDFDRSYVEMIKNILYEHKDNTDFNLDKLLYEITKLTKNYERGDQIKCICKYLFLSGVMSEDFWKSFTKNQDKDIVKEFTIEELSIS